MQQPSDDILIRVMPFEDLTLGSEEVKRFLKAFFASFLTALSKFRHLKITTSPDEASEAGYTIQGSLIGDDNYQVNIQLVNNTNQRVVCAERFNAGSWENKIEEARIAEIISFVNLYIHQDLITSARNKNFDSLSKYEHYLLGMERVRRGSLEQDEVARTHFAKALEQDPCYALAHSGMSLTFFNEWSCQLWERWDDSHRGAYEWAKKAIDFDDRDYIATAILGRVYLYEGAYEIAEHYLRKSLALNTNDADMLMQIATSFIFLGKIDEAERIYQKAVLLDPFITEKHMQVAALISLEKGDYGACISRGKLVVKSWVDFPIVMAAAYKALGQISESEIAWRIFVDSYEKKVNQGRTNEVSDCIEWIKIINPYRVEGNFLRYVNGISPNDNVDKSRSIVKAATAESQNYLLKEGSVWKLSFEGSSSFIPDLKGVSDILRMLAKPGHEFHCTELMGTSVFQKGVAVFDEKARRSYRNRMEELELEIERSNDEARREILNKEYDSILQHVSSATGLKRKVRQVQDPVEKIRSAVTWRIRKAIQEIEKVHPLLAKHLRASVRTGTFCQYIPELKICWIISSPDS